LDITYLINYLYRGGSAPCPNTLSIMWQHSSIGQYILHNTAAGLKSRLDSLGKAHDLLIRMWDYRTNTAPWETWAGWRTDDFDSSNHVCGWMHPQHDIYNYSINNMYIHHLTRFWEGISMTKDSIKGGFLLVDTVVDTIPNPDTLIDITDFDMLWFKYGPLIYVEMSDDSLASYRNQAFRWRDSAALYSDIDFIYIMETPVKYDGRYGVVMDSVDKHNCMAWNAFWLDTLQDLDNYPNFHTWSFYDATVQKIYGDPRYACIRAEYEGDDVHPNMAAAILLQNLIVTDWLPAILNNKKSSLR